MKTKYYRGETPDHFQERLDFSRDSTMFNFGELAHTGWQSSLPGSPERGFLPDLAPTHPWRLAANSSFDKIPDIEQERFIQAARLLTSFVVSDLIYKPKRTVYDVIESGRKAAFTGLVYSLYCSKPGFDPQHSLADENAHKKAVATIMRYDEVDPELRLVDETVFMLSLLGFRRPELFPWVADNWPKRDLKRDGMKEAEVRGLAAIQRVVRIRGRATVLQSSLQKGKHHTI